MMPSIGKFQVMKNSIYTYQDQISSDVHDYEVAKFLDDDTKHAMFRCPVDILNASPDLYWDTKKTSLAITYPAFLNVCSVLSHQYVGTAYRYAMTGMGQELYRTKNHQDKYTCYYLVAAIHTFEALKPQFIGHFSEDEFFRAYKNIISTVLDHMEACSAWASSFDQVLKTQPYYSEVLEMIQIDALTRITPLRTKYRHTHTLERDFAHLGNVLYPNATKAILEQGIHKSVEIDDAIAAPTMDNLLYAEAAAYAHYHSSK